MELNTCSLVLSFWILRMHYSFAIMIMWPAPNEIETPVGICSCQHGPCKQIPALCALYFSSHDPMKLVAQVEMKKVGFNDEIDKDQGHSPCSACRAVMHLTMQTTSPSAIFLTNCMIFPVKFSKSSRASMWILYWRFMEDHRTMQVHNGTRLSHSW